jgi:hypothetical protein
MGGRVAYGSGLENRRGFTPSVSSNLTPSAKLLSQPFAANRNVIIIRVMPL